MTDPTGFSTKSSLLRFEAELPQFEAETAVYLFDARLDRIEAVLRDRMREFIHATFEEIEACRKAARASGGSTTALSSRAWRKPAIDESLEEAGNRLFTSTFRERSPCLNPLRIIIPSRRAAWAEATI